MSRLVSVSPLQSFVLVSNLDVLTPTLPPTHFPEADHDVTSQREAHNRTFWKVSFSGKRATNHYLRIQPQNEVTVQETNIAGKPFFLYCHIFSNLVFFTNIFIFHYVTYVCLLRLMPLCKTCFDCIFIPLHLTKWAVAHESLCSIIKIVNFSAQCSVFLIFFMHR